MPHPPGQFTVVKFVPDSIRFEPVNIGVVLETGSDVITRMAESVDPRIRFADPFADVRSLSEFLGEFDASSLEVGGQSVVNELTTGAIAYPNLFFDTPRPVDASKLSVDRIADALFDRLVRRTFASPSGFQRPASPTAARTALKRAFQSMKLLDRQVRLGVAVRGRSGVEWDMDFEYLTTHLHFVQTATTGLREDLRRNEHAFRAFAALVDTTSVPGTSGILATDEPPSRSDLSGQLAQLAEAHGLKYLGGQRAFLELAQEVKNAAQPIATGPERVALMTDESGQLLLLG